jgi:hypothetical protein
MEMPRASLKELVDIRNRDVLATNTPKLWACYRRSMNRAMYFASLPHPTKTVRDKDGNVVPAPLYPRQLAKIQALNEALYQTASMGGKGLEAVRDAAIGSKMPALAVGVQQPRTQEGVPHL